MVKHRGPTWVPRQEDYRRVFIEQNPWHSDGVVPDVLARPVERPLARILWQRLLHNEPNRFQLILGPRRVGKSTCLYQTVRRLLKSGIPPDRLWWLRLDHPLLMRIELDALARLVVETTKARPEEPVFLFLDELAYADAWDLWLKTFYDDKWPLQISGSSSSTAVLRERRLESGVGRWDEQYLTPYLFTEYLALVDRNVEVPVGASLAETIQHLLDEPISVSGLGELRRRFLLTGGFPELLVAGEGTPLDEASTLLQSQRTLRNDAVERAVYKDIPQAFGVDDPMLLERMLYTLAGQVAGILSPQTLCQSLGGLSQPTFDRYLAYLERAFLVFILPNYSGSESSVQKKRGRKLYFVDGAVRNAALQRGLGPLSDQIEMGLLMENLVAGHLHALSQQSQVRLYHWRHKNDEVDLIYDHPESPLVFEIGLSASHDRKALHQIMTRYKRFQGRCFLVAPDAPPSQPSDNWDRVGTLPLDLLLLATGAQAERELANRLAVSR